MTDTQLKKCNVVHVFKVQKNMKWYNKWKNKSFQIFLRQKLKWIWLARCGTLFLFVTVQRNISQPLNNPSRVIFCLQDVSKENVIKYVWQASVTSRSNLQKAIIYSSIFFEKEKHLLEHVLKEEKGGERHCWQIQMISPSSFQ